MYGRRRRNRAIRGEPPSVQGRTGRISVRKRGSFGKRGQDCSGIFIDRKTEKNNDISIRSTGFLHGCTRHGVLYARRHTVSSPDRSVRGTRRIAADETVRVWRPGASFAMSIRSCYFGRGDRRCFSGIPRISVISVNRTFVRSTTGETGNRARGTKRTRVVSSSLAECVVSFKAGFTKRS